MSGYLSNPYYNPSAAVNPALTGANSVCVAGLGFQTGITQQKVTAALVYLYLKNTASAMTAQTTGFGMTGIAASTTGLSGLVLDLGF